MLMVWLSAKRLDQRIRPPADHEKKQPEIVLGRLLQPCLPCRSISANHRLNTDRWYFRVFQSAPDLIRALLPNRGLTAAGLGLNPEDPGDRLYRFEAPELKELNHRLDGVLWPPRPTASCSNTYRWCTGRCW